MKNTADNWLCVAITEETLRRLLAADQLCAADLHCLDCSSKTCLRRLCLETCIGKKGQGSMMASARVVPWPRDAGNGRQRPCTAAAGPLPAPWAGERLVKERAA